MDSNCATDDLRPDSTVTFELRESVAWLGLDRPQKRNAIDNPLLTALQDSVTRAQADALATVIFGHGPCFGAGLDLAEHRARETEKVLHYSGAWHAVFTANRRVDIPAIAALHDATARGGPELAKACHILLTNTTAFSAMPADIRGIYVGGDISQHLARLLGQRGWPI